jgi:hypothetical protein
MGKSPIIETMEGFLEKLRDATQQRNELVTRIAEYTNAIRALAQACEDEDVKATYLLALEELSGKPGFVDAVKSVLRGKPDGLTPTEIKTWIVMLKKMDLSGYSNPMASIHTTLRRLKESGDVREFQKDGERAYQIVVRAPVPPASMRKKLGL